jgi:hypothetical protein
MSPCNACCAVCGKSFKRLQSHLAHNLACKSYYMLRVNAVATEAATIPNDGKMNTTKVSQGARSSLRKSSAIVREVVDPLHNAKDLNAVEDDDFVMLTTTLYPMTTLAIRTPPTKLKRRKVPMKVCWIVFGTVQAAPSKPTGSLAFFS